jgi:DNA-binding response OmpR family regulator
VTEMEAVHAKADETILVIDDEVLVRLAISRYLRECGFNVIEAANSDEAMLVLQEPELPVHIVLGNVTMRTGMNGFSLARWLREHKPGLPIILAGSHSAAAEAAADLCERGPMLAKPYEPQILLDRIRRLLAEGRPPLIGMPVVDAADRPILIN